VPVSAAKFLGNTTAKYRWFALLYLFVCFFAVPGIFMGLSIASMATCVVVLALAISTMLFVLIVNVLQARRPSALPATLRDWEWLPAWMTSLEPFDRVVCAKLMCCKCCKDKVTSGSGESSSSVSRAVGETSTHHAEELQVATTRIEA
jgi:sodium-dependent phosphate cotransporter